MRVKPEELDGRETRRVYLASSAAEARRVEEALDGGGVEYCIEIEPFVAGFVFGENHGAVYYVPAEKAALAAEVMAGKGLKRGLIEERDQGPSEPDEKKEEPGGEVRRFP